MKKLMVGMLLVAAMFATQEAFAGGIGTYSTGHRIGMVTKFSIKGLMMKSGEGQMLMGRDSTPYVIQTADGDGGTHRKTVNPWYFSSTDPAIQKRIEQSVGEYAVFEYREAHVKLPNVDTDYEIVDVSAPSRTFNETCVAKKFHDGMKSEGVRVGRVVKASSKGVVANSYEIMMQLGNAGNQFKNMSVSSDAALYACLERALMSGKRVKIYYSQSILNLDVFGRNTSYDIVKVEPIGDL